MYSNEGVIQEILHPVLGLGEDLGEDLREGGDGGEVVFLLGSDLPEGGVESVGVERVGGERVVGVWKSGEGRNREERVSEEEGKETRRETRGKRRRDRLTLRQLSVVVQRKLSSSESISVNENHASRVEFEEVVDEGDDHDDGCWRSGKGESTEPFDDGCDEGGGEMAGEGGERGPIEKEDECEVEGREKKEGVRGEKEGERKLTKKTRKSPRDGRTSIGT